MWLGSVTLEQWDELVPIFAKLTENGWVIPTWLVDMKTMIESQK